MKNMSPNGIGITPTQFEKILRIAAAQAPVRDALIRSHDNSTWWPKHVKDWRTRMLIAGLSARISYRMVPIYREIVDKLDSTSWADLSIMPEKEIESVISRIGLRKARIRFWKSLVLFINSLADKKIDIGRLGNDELISLMQASVDGASYKLAQCCVLYARGYYCGVMPVDSGMKDMLCPCLGFHVPPGAYGHEALRVQLESLTSSVDCRKIAHELGYGALKFPDQGALTWWAHIVLISYKRFFCNTHNPERCSFRNTSDMGIDVGRACAKRNPEYGGVRAVIIEGVDGSGKTSLARLISRQGYRNCHFDYHGHRTGRSLKNLYRNFIETSKGKRVILDRSFISEEVYGPVLRRKSRLGSDDFRDLLDLMGKFRAIVVYLHAPKSTILQRVARRPLTSKNDVGEFDRMLPLLESKYEQVLGLVEHHIPVMRFDTSRATAQEIVSSLFS